MSNDVKATGAVRIILSRAGEDDNLTAAVAAALAAEGLAVLITPPLEHLAESSPLWERIREEMGPLPAAVSEPAGSDTGRRPLCIGTPHLPAVEPWGPAAHDAAPHGQIVKRLLVASPLHTRALRALLARHEVPDSGLAVLRSADFTTPEEFAAAALDALGSKGGAGEGSVEAVQEPTAARWFPVIDRERCRHCGNCFQFCLFGVYEQDDAGRVKVANPDNCKPGCPACARICPAGAIIFPLYDQDPAICGAPGQYLTLDAESRRLYYERTGAECRVCGPQGDPALYQSGLTECPECGRDIAPRTPVMDEIDALISDLDDWSRRSL